MSFNSLCIFKKFRNDIFKILTSGLTKRRYFSQLFLAKKLHARPNPTLPPVSKIDTELHCSFSEKISPELSAIRIDHPTKFDKNTINSLTNTATESADL